MKNTITTLIFCLLFVLGFGQNSDYSNQIILKLKQDVKFSKKTLLKQNQIGNNQIDFINNKYKVKSVKKQKLGKFSKSYIYIIKFPENSDIKKIIQDYYDSKKIEYAEPDFKGEGAGKTSLIPNDPNFQNQWGLKNIGSFSNSIAGADIDMENAWGITQGSSNVIVAVLDSGAKLDHPEFSGRIWNNSDEILNNGLDDDNNGNIDDNQGWDFVNNDNSPIDDHGHGTNVTGIIGANGNNNIGYAGVDWNCKLMILKVLDNTNSGYYSWWTSAIYYAVDNGARVINMSLGGLSTSTTIQNAINYANSNNVSVIACMMNTNSNVNYYPAALNGVIAVGATNSNDRRSSPFFWSSTSGSNFGNHISVVAPGNFIYGLNHLSNTNYQSYWGGTSQATPYVTGLASLLISQNSNITPQQIKTIIENSAEDQVGNPIEDILGWDQYYGRGRINAFEALKLNQQLAANSFQNLNENLIKIFPNPAKNNFTVFFPINTDEVNIYNSLGQLIISKKTQNLTSINLEILNSGIYFAVVNFESKSISKKIIIQ